MIITLNMHPDDLKLVRAALVVLSKRQRIDAQLAMEEAAKQLDGQLYPGPRVPVPPVRAGR